MGTGLNIRPVQASSFVPVRAEAAQGRQVTPTELPEVQTVTAVSDVRPVQRDTLDQQPKFTADINRSIDALAEPSKKVTIDETTRELIFRTINAQTGAVVTQFPDDAILRQRAYNLQQERQELLKSSEVKISDAIKTTVEKIA